MSVLVALQGDPNNREVTFQVTGGGVVNAVTRKGALSTVAVTGGGIIAITARKGAQITVSLTGGGVIAMSVSKGGAVIAQITGGGVITPSFAKGGTVILNVTGGGVITIQSESAQAEDAQIVVEQTDGRGRRGPTPFDDWSLMDDDEAIVELYSLRKTR